MRSYDVRIISKLRVQLVVRNHGGQGGYGTSEDLSISDLTKTQPPLKFHFKDVIDHRVPPVLSSSEARHLLAPDLVPWPGHAACPMAT